MMWNWGAYWMPWMPFWPILMIGMIALCIVVMSMMMRGGGMHPPWQRFPGDVGKTARDTLDERYARGEIDRAEYDIKRHDLAS